MIYFSKVKENLPGNTKMIEIDTNLGNLFLLREANKKPPKCIFFSPLETLRDYIITEDKPS